MKRQRAIHILTKAFGFLVDAEGGRLEQIDNAEKVWSRVQLLSDDKRKEFNSLLKLLDNSSMSLIAGSGFRKINTQDQIGFEKAMLRWANSPSKTLRHAANTLSRVLLLVHYSRDDDGTNSEWADLGYPGPPDYQNEWVKKYASIHYKDSNVQHCEYLVVGSGAGGGVAAGLLAEAGKDVVVVEKGRHLDGEELSGRELEMYGQLYDSGGLLETKDGSVGLLAGNCLGGGTTVNWSASFRLSPEVMDGWRRRHFLEDISIRDFEDSYSFIENRLQVHSNDIEHNPQNNLFIDAAEQLGYHYANVPLNQRRVDSDAEAEKGFTCFGDPTGVKQSTLRTFLKSSVEHGAKILSKSRVVKLNLEGTRVRSAIVEDADLRIDSREIKAENVILAGGALNSSLVLRQSGLNHSHLGKNLHLHPTAPVAGYYPQNLNSWHGNILSVSSDEFSNLDEGFGVKIETAPVHPGIAAVLFPWKSKEQHHKMMRSISNSAVFVPLLRDRFGGEVKMSGGGGREIHYKLSPYDLAHTLKGVKECIKMHFAAGAEWVMLPHNSGRILKREDLMRIDEILNGMTWRSCQIIQFSAHQMGTCAMGGNSASHPVQPDGKVRGLDNCFLADSSVFPEASGVNPMLTIMALAARTVKQLV